VASRGRYGVWTGVAEDAVVALVVGTSAVVAVVAGVVVVGDSVAAVGAAVVGEALVVLVVVVVVVVLVVLVVLVGDGSVDGVDGVVEGVVVTGVGTDSVGRPVAVGVLSVLTGFTGRAAAVSVLGAGPRSLARPPEATRTSTASSAPSPLRSKYDTQARAAET
jgi:hypothetical protein